MKRTLATVAVVILLLGIGVAIYFLFFAKPSVTTAPGTGLPIAGQGTPQPGETTGGPNTPNTPETISPRLVKISSGPAALGEVVVTKAGNASTSAETAVSYVERQSGNIFVYSSKTKTTTRTSNKT